MGLHVIDGGTALPMIVQRRGANLPAVVVLLDGPRHGRKGYAELTERSARRLASELLRAAEKIEAGEVT